MYMNCRCRPTLSGIVGIRRLVVSLAWFTPINPLDRDYRRAGLWVSTPESALNTDRVCADWQTVQRGTMQHEIFEGDDAVAFIDGATIRLKVNCRADAGRLDERVPYGLAVTLEAAEALRQNLQLGRDYRDHIARYFGYGAARLERVLAVRITA